VGVSLSYCGGMDGRAQSANLEWFLPPRGGTQSFDMGGSASLLSAAQEDALKVFVSATLSRSTRHVRAWIEIESSTTVMAGPFPTIRVFADT
jgi:hypothetical protein